MDSPGDTGELRDFYDEDGSEMAQIGSSDESSHGHSRRGRIFGHRTVFTLHGIKRRKGLAKPIHIVYYRRRALYIVALRFYFAKPIIWYNCPSCPSGEQKQEKDVTIWSDTFGRGTAERSRLKGTG